MTISKNIKVDLEELDLKPAFKEENFTEEYIENILNRVTRKPQNNIQDSKSVIESESEKSSKLENILKNHEANVDSFAILCFAEVMCEYEQCKGNYLFYSEESLLRLMKVKANTMLQEIVEQTKLNTTVSYYPTIPQNLVENLVIEKFKEIYKEFDASKHKDSLSSIFYWISAGVEKYCKSHNQYKADLKNCNETIELHKKSIEISEKELATVYNNTDDVVYRVNKYKEYIETNGFYRKADAIRLLEEMTKEKFEKAKADKSIITNCSFEELQEQTSFENQLAALDLTEVEEIVFCWPNTGKHSPYNLPMESCCVSDHPIVNHWDTKKIKTLYADLADGSVHLSKFDFHNIDLWKKFAEKLDGHKIKSIVDCADSGWSEKQAFHHPFTNEFIETTKYIQENILAKNGKIICSIHVESLQPFDFEAAYADSELNGEVSEVHSHE